MRGAAYILTQAIWGFPQTLAGAVVYATQRGRPHVRFHGAIVTTWTSRRALSLGPFIFVNGNGREADQHAVVGKRPAQADENAALASPPMPAAATNAAEASERLDALAVDRRLLVHEYGHTIQSLMLGPLYLVVIGLPSALWLNTPSFVRKRRQGRTSYYAFYTERWANRLGERALGEPSVGLAFID